MDPLSDVLSLLKPQSYRAGGYEVGDDMAIRWPKHRGIKCYAMVSGQCWLSVEGVPDAVLLTAGDCFLLPRGCPSASRPICHSRLSTSTNFSQRETPVVRSRIKKVRDTITKKVENTILSAATSSLPAATPTSC